MLSFIMSTVKLDLPSKSSYGDWGIVQYCPWGSYAKRASIKVEKYQGSRGDDSAVNGVRFDCFEKDRRIKTATIESTVQKWGSWQPTHACRNGFVNEARLRSYPPEGGRLVFSFDSDPKEPMTFAFTFGRDFSFSSVHPPPL